uniref:Uncharacterized protein n=2 Tax=Babesia bovis TaxID=5865 RepID=A7ARA9_BABBO|eukprot:XP_001610646.1 hypothetical protein [Babesia bovis T2Bo]
MLPNRTKLSNTPCGEQNYKPHAPKGITPTTTKRHLNLSHNRISFRCKVRKQHLDAESVNYFNPTKRCSNCKRKCHKPEVPLNSLQRNLMDVYGNKHMMNYSVQLNGNCDYMNYMQHSNDHNSVMIPSNDSELCDSMGSLLDATQNCINGVDLFRERNLTTPYLIDDAKHSLIGWKRHFMLLKRRIFQVCNILFININVPFIAVSLFSHVFHNISTNTPLAIRSRLRYIFNHRDANDKNVQSSASESISEDDQTMLFMLAANCLEIALSHHNGFARFDLFSIFYFMVFVESILTANIRDAGDSKYQTLIHQSDHPLKQQKRCNLHNYSLKRNLKYHHDIFKRELFNLAKEIKKNRVLSVVNFNISNCLEEFMLMSHGIYGMNLNLKMGQSIIGFTNCARYGSVSREYANGQHRNSHTSRCFQSTYIDDSRLYNGKNKTQSKIIKQRNYHRMEGVLLKNEKINIKDTPVSSYGVPPITYPPSKQANALVTESSEVSILLLQLLQCSDYFEIICGNGIFATPGCNIKSNSLIAALVLRFVLDIYVAVTDEVIHQMLSTRSRKYRKNTADPLGLEFLSTFKVYMGEDYRIISDNNCILYFVLLEIDWIFHKEGIYTTSEYINHQQLLDRTLELDSGFGKSSPSDIFESHYRLYEQMVGLLIGTSPLNPRTSLCVDAYRNRNLSWNTFDEVDVRCVKEEHEIYIGREILDIYYSDLTPKQPCFNPYKSIFTPKYFAITKDIIYRVKAVLLLSYMSHRRSQEH